MYLKLSEKKKIEKSLQVCIFHLLVGMREITHFGLFTQIAAGKIHSHAILLAEIMYMEAG